ncbi:MAG: HAD family phosphatase [Candidatus Doudnabacteria bacterium]|jgi:beta-phosphoglucomutase-like phosphatase (HAD superfamily)
MIKAIIFDAEGVVIDTHSLWVRGDIKFIKNHSSVQNPEKIYHENIVSKIVGHSILDGAIVMQKILGFPGEPEDLAKERMVTMENLFENDIKFIDGFVDFFNAQVKNIYKTAIGTAIKKELMTLVEKKLPIREFFGKDVYHIYDVGNISKPNPDIFLYTAKQLGVAPEECVVIEDAPNGIKAAKRAGMKCIALTTTFHKDKLTEADIIVEHFKNINLDEI